MVNYNVTVLVNSHSELIELAESYGFIDKYNDGEQSFEVLDALQSEAIAYLDKLNVDYTIIWH